MREESKSYARKGLTSINKVYDSEIDRVGNALEMRGNLIVLGSTEEVVKGIKVSIILVFVGSKLINEMELKSDEFR